MSKNFNTKTKEQTHTIAHEKMHAFLTISYTCTNSFYEYPFDIFARFRKYTFIHAFVTHAKISVCMTKKRELNPGFNVKCAHTFSNTHTGNVDCGCRRCRRQQKQRQAKRSKE